MSIGYGNKAITEGLTFVLKSGELTCLIGRNGLGKSTLLRTIAGFQRPMKGKIIGSFDKGGSIEKGGFADKYSKGESNSNKGKEYDLTHLSKQSLARLVAVVLTEKVDIANVTAYDVVGMGRMPYTGFFGKLRDDDKAVVRKALAMTGTSDFADRDIGELSDGERQKVMIARALAQETPVILLDEPTAFLDYESKTETFRLLQSLAHDMGKIVLASTHDLDIAVRFADRLITINQGIREIGIKQLAESLHT